MDAHASPVGGPLLTRPYKLLLFLIALGVAAVLWRFGAGLGRSTALSDGYPWGLWIAFDVVTGTALACGGYAMALLVYILNKGRYHPLVRPAVLTSALGYSIATITILIDVGRPWLAWKVPLFVWRWNTSSVLLEVALCIMAYVLVLWIELAPAFLERWREGSRPGLKRLAERTLPGLDRALIWILALGLLLPTMHQSSLGTLMLLAGPRLHPLWNTSLAPLLFLVSCLAMGYAMVVLEATFSAAAFRRRPETPMLAVLERIGAWTGVGFALLRLGDMAVRGRLGIALKPTYYGLLFWFEIGLFLMPMAMLHLPGTGGRVPLGRLFRAGMALALGGGLYRFDTYLVAFNPGPGWHYFPSVPEIFVTLGLLSLEAAGYFALVKRFPILGGATPAPAPAH